MYNDHVFGLSYDVILNKNSPLLLQNDGEYNFNHQLLPFVLSLFGQLLLFPRFTMKTYTNKTSSNDESSINTYHPNHNSTTLLMLGSSMFIERACQYQSEMMGCMAVLMVYQTFGTIIDNIVKFITNNDWKSDSISSHIDIINIIGPTINFGCT